MHRLGKMKSSIDRDMQVLQALCEKVDRIKNFEKYSVNEGKVSILVEAVTQKDMAVLNQVMQNFQKRILQVRKQLESLEGNAKTNEAQVQTSLDFLKEFVNSYDESLKSLMKSAANADFTTGYWASGWAKGMTIPGMVTVATTAASRLSEFIKGFDNFKDKMNKTVISKLKADQLEKSLVELSGDNVDGLPDTDVVVNFASQAFSKSAPGWWEKAKNVMKSIVSPAGSAAKMVQKNTSAVKSAIEKFPSSTVNAKKIGEAVGNIFVNVKASSLKSLPAGEQPPAVEPLQQAIVHSEKSKTQGLESMASGAPSTGAGKVEVDGTVYVKSKKGNWYEQGAKDIAKSAKDVQKNTELVDKINKAAGGKAPQKVDTDLSDEEKKSAKEVLSKVRGKLSQGAQDELKKLGIFGESARKESLKEELLTSKRRKNSFGVNETSEETERWNQLAGLK